MTEKERQEKIAELQREIESLPKGYISTKTVKGNYGRVCILYGLRRTGKTTLTR